MSDLENLENELAEIKAKMRYPCCIQDALTIARKQELERLITEKKAELRQVETETIQIQETESLQNQIEDLREEIVNGEGKRLKDLLEQYENRDRVIIDLSEKIEEWKKQKRGLRSKIDFESSQFKLNEEKVLISYMKALKELRKTSAEEIVKRELEFNETNKLKESVEFGIITEETLKYEEILKKSNPETVKKLYVKRLKKKAEELAEDAIRKTEEISKMAKDLSGIDMVIEFLQEELLKLKEG